MLIIPALCAGLLLAACDGDEQQYRLAQQPGVTAVTLPPLPTDIAACLKKSGVKVPNRALTVEEVERFWKTDRLTLVVMRNCGDRVLAFYNAIRGKYR
jgi:hypothetical protein